MFEILRKSLSTGIVTSSYPEGPPEVSDRSRGSPDVDFSRWQSPAAAIAACPTGALSCTEQNGTRTLSLDLANCTFCGLCAEVEPAIRMTNNCELASARRDDLILSAEYQTSPGGPSK